MTDREVARANRLADFNKYRIPPIKRVVLPEIPHGTSIAAFSWSLNDGIKWRVCSDYVHVTIATFEQNIELCLFFATYAHVLCGRSTEAPVQSRSAH